MAANTTHYACSWNGLSESCKGVFITLCIILVFSLSWNIRCCVSKCCSVFKGKGRCFLRTRRSRSSRHMEDNPIYGNITYQQGDVGVYTEADPPRSSLNSSSLRNPQRLISDTQTQRSSNGVAFCPETEGLQNSEHKNQDCYANLTLKAPRVQSGRSSPQMHYSDVVHLEEPTETEREHDGNADAVSTMSDLYASVQTQRSKTVDPAEDGEGYANHL